MILKYYLVINALIILAYVIFKTLRLSQIKISFQSLNKIAQALLITAIASPILFSALPKQALTNVEVQIRSPLPEGLTTKIIDKSQKVLKPLSPPQYIENNEQENQSLPITTILLAIWLTGFALITANLSKNYLKLKTILNQAIPIRKIGKVQIYVSDQIKIPFSTLIGKGASVVVPTDVLTSQKDLRMIIQHEIHHHRNGDTLWALIIEILTIAFYLNPIIYLFKKEITEIQEFACDETLIRQMRLSMHEYGHCLVKIAEAAQGQYQVQVGTTCMGAGPENPQQLKSFLRRRIEMFQVHRKQQKKTFLALAIGTMSLFITAGVAYGVQKTLRTDTAQKPNSGTAEFDPIVQKTTQDILNKYVKKFGAKGGFVVVSDPATGRILAAADAGKMKKQKHWVLSYELEPASVMKGLITATALDKKVLTLDEKLDCENGNYNYGGRTYRDWKGFKSLTVTESVTNSSNICGIKIGERLGIKGLETSLKEFGFGTGGSTEGFPEAMAGRIPNPSDIPDSAYVPVIATGYTGLAKFYVTPLEVVQAYGAIANDGKLMKPTLVSQSRSPETIRQVITPETSEKMKGILSAVVKNGTGKNAQSSLYTTAGKTSTAYAPSSPEHGTLGGENGIAGFVGFAPTRAPKLVVYVGIIDPTSSKDRNPHGGEHAAPVFKEVIETVLQQMKVAPDNSASM